MSWTLPRFQIATAWVVAVPWTVFWVLMVVRLHQAPQPAVYGLLFSTLTWVGAALILLGRWWSGTGYGSTALDPPGALLEAAVVALPKRRREWGTAMLAELAEVRGRSERWGSRSAVSGPRCRCGPWVAGQYSVSWPPRSWRR